MTQFMNGLNSDNDVNLLNALSSAIFFEAALQVVDIVSRLLHPRRFSDQSDLAHLLESRRF